MSAENENYQPIEEIEKDLDKNRSLLLEMGFTEEQLQVSSERRSQECEGFHTELIVPKAEPSEIIEKVEDWMKGLGSVKITEDILADLHDGFNLFYYHQKGESLPKEFEYLKHYLELPLIDPEMPIVWGPNVSNTEDNDIQREKKLNKMYHHRSATADAYTLRLMDVENLRFLPYNSWLELADYKYKSEFKYPNSPLKSPTVPEFLLWLSYNIVNQKFRERSYSKVSGTTIKGDAAGMGYSFSAGIPHIASEHENQIKSGKILIRSAREDTFYDSNDGFYPLVVIPASMKKEK